MAWAKKEASATKHTHAANFGKKVDGCPRCAEINSGTGAPVVKWNIKQSNEARRLAEWKAHDCTKSRCGVVCTFGEW